MRLFGNPGGEKQIAKQKRTSGRTEIGWDPGQANPKQLEFFNSRTLYRNVQLKPAKKLEG